MAAGALKGTKQRHGVAIWLIMLCSLLSHPALADGDIVWDGIREPGLKDALYLSYKGLHFDAIVRLQTEQKQGRIKDQEQAGLVLGGLYLAYGFHQEAEKIFEAFLDKEQPPAVANQAWFYLAKTLYQRGRFQLALNALERIQGNLGLRLQPERVALQSMVYMNLGEYDAALKILPEVGKDSRWWAYSRYNMGVALYRLGHKEQGINILDEVGSLADAGQEARVVKDKANLALGYGYLAANQPERAMTVLNRMLLDGPYANRALLGLGRAYSAKKEHEKSLIPWLKLVQRQQSDPAVQDALMAVPYAFGQLQAYKQSLDYYEKAMLAFQQEIQAINTAADAVGGGKLIEGLIRAESGESVGGMWNLKKVLDTPEGRYLWPLLASREFTETFYNYKQLRMSLGKLEGWSAALGTYKSLDDKQRETYKSRITHLQSRVLLASEKLNHHLQSLAYDELDRRKKRLVNYFNEARFSVAQIYDYAAKRWGTARE